MPNNSKKTPKLPTHFIAIGASAGGLEALQELFEHMPCDSGAGFIVIQHLSPDFKSVMDELLSRCTKMPVCVVKDGVLIEANTVYLIPPRKNMIISQGRLLLSEQSPQPGMHCPLDVFFAHWPKINNTALWELYYRALAVTVRAESKT